MGQWKGKRVVEEKGKGRRRITSKGTLKIADTQYALLLYGSVQHREDDG